MTAALLAAMIAVESGGDCRAVGDQGRSIGILQISRGVVEDVNRIRGTHYKWPDDCFDRKKSVEICVAYLNWYGGKSKSLEKAARQWNGGPKGHRNAETRDYWKRVKQHLTQ
tara:strand:+ start:349 stop:684 length:336 start_codon:yes stop_codon:yes gene_type:complete